MILIHTALKVSRLQLSNYHLGHIQSPMLALISCLQTIGHQNERTHNEY